MATCSTLTRRHEKSKSSAMELVRLHCRVPHFGHTMSFERAAASGAEISVLQCGHMRTATIHLPRRTITIVEVAARMKRGDEARENGSLSLDVHRSRGK